LKNKGVITVIIMILITGILTTIGTSRFIAEKKAEISSQTELAMDYDASAFAEGAAGGLEDDKAATGPQADARRSGAANGVDQAAGSRMSEKRAVEGLNQESAVYSEAGEADSDGELHGQKSRASIQRLDAASSETGQEDMLSGRIKEDDSTADRGTEDGAGQSLQSGSAEVEEADEEALYEVSGSIPDNAPISPLTGGSSRGLAAADETMTLGDYQKRLEEIDTLVTNMKESDVISNTDSISNIADYEYRLWDAELNRIYQAIMGAMTQEEAEQLRTEERGWLKVRDQAANQAASKYKGGTMERLEYTASMAFSTRERAYELLEDYGQYLPQE